MGLESATYISGLSASNPINATDVVGQGDDHLRLIKSTLLNTFPNLTGAMTKTHTALNNAAIKTDATNTFDSTLLEQAVSSDTSLDFVLRNQQGGFQIRMLAGSGNARIGQTNAAGSYQETWILAVRNGEVQLNHDDDLALETTSSGVAIRPSSGASDNNVRLIFRESGGDDKGFLGHPSSTTLNLRNQVHGGAIVLSGEDSGGSLNSFFVADPDGGVELFFDGDEALIITGSGAIIRDPASGGSNAELGFQANDGTDVGLIFAGTGQVILRGEVNSQLMNIDSLNSSGARTDIFLGDPDGASSMYYDGNAHILTQANGMQLRPGGPTDNTQFLMENSSGGNVAQLNSIQSNGELVIDNLVDGSNLELRATTAGGSIQDLFVGDPDGAASLYFNGVGQFRTKQSGGAHNTSGAEVADHAGTFRDVGFNVMPPETITASMTLDEADVGKHVRKSGGGTATLVTLPSGTSGAVPPVGATIVISNFDTETMTIAAAGTLHWLDGSDGAAPTGTRTLARSGVCTVWKGTSTDWYIWGNGLS